MKLFTKSCHPCFRIALIMLLSYWVSGNRANAQSVGISNVAITADPSSILELRTTSKGLLIPRMTAANKTSLTATAANGLLIYQTDGTSGFYFFNGLAWVNLGAGSVSSVGLTTGSAGTDVAVLGSPLSANGSITLNIPTSSATNRGVLSSTDWSAFNGKQATISATSPLSLTGTSIGIVNQGSSTTVLHGNAAGNASFGALSLVSDVTGTLPISNGGTGQTTYTDGQLLIGNTTGNTLTKATITAGDGITITNGNGRIEIAATPYTGTFMPTNFTTTPNSTIITATSSTAYTVPTNVYRITIEAVGGSGGGGGSGGDGSGSNGRGGTGGGGGGGAGEYAGEIIAVKPGDIIDVTIGAAGAAGTAGAINTSGGVGGDGGQTIVKLGSGGTTILTANGGKGGSGSPTNSTSSSTAGGALGLGGTGSSAGQQSNGLNGTGGGASSGSGSGNAGTGGIGPHPTSLSSNVGGNGGAGVYVSNNTSVGRVGLVGAAGKVVISYSAY